MLRLGPHPAEGRDATSHPSHIPYVQSEALAGLSYITLKEQESLCRAILKQKTLL